MTTLTTTRPLRDTGMRPLPWWRMAWVVWRQHRLVLSGVVAILGATALYLLVVGPQVHQAHAAAAACEPAGSAPCQQALNDFSSNHSYPAGVVAALLQVVPPLIGAFVGAPLLAREFETGTFRYAFTQGFGRTRWTVAKLAPLAVVVTGLAGAFSQLFSWCYGPLIGTIGYSPLAPTFFDVRGVAFAAWTLAAFAIGVVAGVLIRRVIPAMFATLAAWTGLAVATGLWLRPHYLAPLVTTDPDIGLPAWVMSQTWTLDGQPAGLADLQASLGPVGVHVVTPEVFQPSPRTPEGFDLFQYLATQGFTHLTTYQPAERF